jgi:hypothetical protein
MFVLFYLFFIFNIFTFFTMEKSNRIKEVGRFDKYLLYCIKEIGSFDGKDIKQNSNEEKNIFFILSKFFFEERVDSYYDRVLKGYSIGIKKNKIFIESCSKRSSLFYFMVDFKKEGIFCVSFLNFNDVGLGSQCTIDRFYVSSKLRGAGLGKFFMNSILNNVFLSDSICIVDLFSLDENSEKFYLKSGFKIQNYNDKGHLFFYKFKD